MPIEWLQVSGQYCWQNRSLCTMSWQDFTSYVTSTTDGCTWHHSQWFKGMTVDITKYKGQESALVLQRYRWVQKVMLSVSNVCISIACVWSPTSVYTYLHVWVLVTIRIYVAVYRRRFAINWVPYVVVHYKQDWRTVLGVMGFSASYSYRVWCGYCVRIYIYFKQSSSN